jgi:hypothetical protein
MMCTLNHVNAVDLHKAQIMNELQRSRRRGCGAISTKQACAVHEQQPRIGSGDVKHSGHP